MLNTQHLQKKNIYRINLLDVKGFFLNHDNWDFLLLPTEFR